MADLGQLAKIEADSVADPSSSDPDVVRARLLRGRVRMLLRRKAAQYIDKYIQDTPVHPETGIRPNGKASIDRMIFAQQSLQNADTYLAGVFGLVLLAIPANTSVDDILNLGDPELNGFMTPARLEILAYRLQ